MEKQTYHSFLTIPYAQILKIGLVKYQFICFGAIPSVGNARWLQIIALHAIIFKFCIKTLVKIRLPVIQPATVAHNLVVNITAPHV